MLQFLRNKAQSTIIQIVVVLIALVFIFWGVGTNLMNPRQAAITVNGQEITFQEFQQAYDKAQENLAAQFGGTLPKGLAETFGIKQQVINQLIQTALLRQGAVRMGITVSQEEIQNTINNMPQFQESGGFSLEKYRDLLSVNRLTPTKFEANMRIDMLAEKAIREIGKFAAVASDYEVEELYRRENEQVSVLFTHISPEDVKADVTISEEELASWFETVRSNYQSEPKLQLKYLAYTYAAIGEKIAIDEDKIAAYYNEHLSSYSSPEERHARHILIRTDTGDTAETLQDKKRRAEEIRQLALSSDDFAALAREYSEGPSKDDGGDLGFFTMGAMVPEFDQAVFSLQKGAISDVVQTQFGFHVIKLEAIKPASTKTLQEVHDEIHLTLQSEEAKPLAFQLANDAYEGIISAGSLQAYVDSHPEAELNTTDYFARNSPPEDLAADQDFLDSAFALNQGELSSLVKTPAGYYIIFAEDKKEAELPDLADVDEQARADYIDIKATELAEQKANDLLARLQGGDPLETLANEAGLPVENSGLMGKKGAEQSSFPASLVDQAFKLSATSPLPQNIGKAGNSLYIYVFDQRHIPEISGNEAELLQYREALLRSKRQEILSAYLDHLQKDAKITIHKSL